jgi:antitoxin (DNA-binding transcriptional repressor) of toxin-antitoxin stability system
MTKHVAITEAETHLKDLVAEVELTGDEIVLTRDGAGRALAARRTAGAKRGSIGRTN